MANHLETTTDTPSTTSDANVASKALISEVVSDRTAAKSTDPKAADQSVSNYIKSTFGDLIIVGDHANDATPLAGEKSDATTSTGDSKGHDGLKTDVGDTLKTAAGDMLKTAAGDMLSAGVLTNNSIWSIFERQPSEEDKQALRDLGQKARDKVAEQLEPEKKAQVDKLGDGITDEKAKEQFKRDIETVEHRNPPVSLAERGRLYNEVSRLMEADDSPNSPLNADERTKLAQEIMHKAADPTSVDQGLKGTCNVATIEARTFTRDPSAAAKLIVDVATAGEYTAPDGTKVKPDPGSIKPDNEVQHAGLLKNPRDHADQIFQVTAVNAAWQTHDLHVNDGQGGTRTFPKGTVEYRETDPNKTDEQIGEGLYDKSKHPAEPIMENGENVNQPHLDGNQMTDVANLISGRNDKDFVLEHSGPRSAEKTFKIDSEQQLKDKLKDMKEHGQLPAIIEVNTGSPPFWGENISLRPGFITPKSGINGEHVVTVTDYDEKTGLVSLDNQWGKGRDHLGDSGISTGDLYIATMPPGSKETIDILQRDVDWNRAHNSINTFKELELLRQKNVGGKLSQDDFKSQLDKTMDEAKQRWEASGTKPDDLERKQAEEYYAKINKSLEKLRIIHM